MKNRICAVVTVLFLMFSLCVTAYAHEVPNPEENGTITFTMDWEGVPLNSGSLSMYKVGELAEEDGNYGFVLIEQLRDSGLSLADPEDPALAAQLADLTDGLEKRSADIKEGKAVFTDVEPGLYVVVQAEKDASNGFAAISPFLISMPNYENGHYVTQVTANPKVPLVTEPTESRPPETTKPSDPKLPQTGQLNWPVPLLAVLGLVLFATGWMLCFGRRKES